MTEALVEESWVFVGRYCAPVADILPFEEKDFPGPSPLGDFHTGRCRDPSVVYAASLYWSVMTITC